MKETVSATRLERRLRQVEKGQVEIQSAFNNISATLTRIAEQVGHTATKVDGILCHNCQDVQQQANDARRQAINAKDHYDAKLRELGIGRVERGHSAVFGAVRGG